MSASASSSSSSSSSSSAPEPFSWQSRTDFPPEVRDFLDANAELVEAIGFMPFINPMHYFKAPKIKGPGRFLKATHPKEFNKPQGQFEWSTGETVKPIFLGIVSNFSNDAKKLAAYKYGGDWTVRMTAGPKAQANNPYAIHPEGGTYLFRVQCDFMYVLDRAGVWFAALGRAAKCEPVRTFSATIPADPSLPPPAQTDPPTPPPPPRVITIENFAQATEQEQGYFCTHYLEVSTEDTFPGKTHPTLNHSVYEGKEITTISASTRMFKPNFVESMVNGRKVKKALPFDASVLPDLTGKFADLREYMEGECATGKLALLPNIYLPTPEGPVATTGDDRFDLLPGAIVLLETTYCWSFAARGNGGITFKLQLESITLLKQGVPFKEATIEERAERAMAPKAAPPPVLAALAARLARGAVTVGGDGQQMGPG